MHSCAFEIAAVRQSALSSLPTTLPCWGVNIERSIHLVAFCCFAHQYLKSRMCQGHECETGIYRHMPATPWNFSEGSQDVNVAALHVRLQDG